MNSKIAVLILLLATGCASMKDYEEKGANNMKVVFNADGAFMASTSMFMYIWEYFPNCTAKFLGVVELDTHETKNIYLPIGRNLAFQGDYVRTLNRTVITKSHVAFKIVPSKTATYEFTLEEDDGDIGRKVVAVSGGKRTEIASAGYQPNCKEWKTLED